VGFEPTIPAFELTQTVYALDSATTVIGGVVYRLRKQPEPIRQFLSYFSLNILDLYLKSYCPTINLGCGYAIVFIRDRMGTFLAKQSTQRKNSGVQNLLSISYSWIIDPTWFTDISKHTKITLSRTHSMDCILMTL
jgi:hypothetical protein